jgi:hypothetical protein
MPSSHLLPDALSLEGSEPLQKPVSFYLKDAEGGEQLLLVEFVKAVQAETSHETSTSRTV